MDWLGMSNGPGEWAVAYHGTAFDNLKSIGNTGLREGTAQGYANQLNINPLSKN